MRHEPITGSAPLVGTGREAEIFAFGEGRVVRVLRWRDGRRRLEREASVMATVRSTGLPVPDVYEIVDVDGRPGLVMDRVDGSDLLTSLSRRPWKFVGAARDLGRAQARLHEVVAPSGLPELRSELRDRVETVPHLAPELRSYARALLAQLPDSDRVCHGDFHPGNVIFTATGPVIIDWTGATRGDPTGDLARTILILRLAAMPADMSPWLRAADRMGRQLFRRIWLRGYRGARAVNCEQLQQWETVCAAARLGEGIDEEVPALLALLEQRYERGSGMSWSKRPASR